MPHVKPSEISQLICKVAAIEALLKDRAARMREQKLPKIPKEFIAILDRAAEQAKAYKMKLFAAALAEPRRKK